MARWIDDIIKSVQDHPHISPVHKLVLIARLEQLPTKEEINRVCDQRDGKLT